MVNLEFKVSIVLMLLIFTNAQEESCKEYIRANFTIKDGGFYRKPPSLTSVIADNHQETKCERWLRLEGTKISIIKGNVFNNLLIDGLEIIKGNSILIDKKAFNGLPVLRSLKVQTKPLFLLSISPDGNHDEDQEAFQPISNITHLEYPFYDDQRIKEIIPILGKIKFFKMTGNIPEIKSDTFINVSQSLMRLEVATSGGMKINSEAFSGLEGLTELIFTDTIINYLAPHAFERLDKLETLSIWFNSLSDVREIQKNIFNKFKSLKKLVIRRDSESFFYDSTMEIESSAFSGLVIETLDLRYLSIGKTSTGAFDGLVVENLHLQIGDISFGTFKGPNITNVHLY